MVNLRLSEAGQTDIKLINQSINIKAISYNEYIQIYSNISCRRCNACVWTVSKKHTPTSAAPDWPMDASGKQFWFYDGVCQSAIIRGLFFLIITSLSSSSSSFFSSNTTPLPSLRCVVLTYLNLALPYRHTEAGVTRELSRLITISTLLSTALSFFYFRRRRSDRLRLILFRQLSDYFFSSLF
jgi:hypothetical protein